MYSVGTRLLVKASDSKKGPKVKFSNKSGGLSHELKAKVASGGAHWVTIKEGPLEGRHILIDGPRPAAGEKSSGKILAGHGIPMHLLERLHGKDSDHPDVGGEVQHTEEDHIMGHLSRLPNWDKAGDVAKAHAMHSIKQRFEKGHNRIVVAQKPNGTIGFVHGNEDLSDQEIVRAMANNSGWKRGTHFTVIHKFGSEKAKAGPNLYNGNAENMDSPKQKEKKQRSTLRLGDVHKFAASVHEKLSKFGVSDVEFNKASATDAERHNIAQAAQKAFDILGRIMPSKPLKYTTVKLVLGKLEHNKSAWAYYLPSGKSIYMSSKDKDGMRPFYHEYGHALDHAMGHYGFYASEKGFLKPLIDDIQKTESHHFFIDNIGRRGTWAGYSRTGRYGVSYYKSGRETFARFFSVYVQRKAKENGIELPYELAEGERFEQFSNNEFKHLASVFEGLLEKQGLNKNAILGTLFGQERPLEKGKLSGHLAAKVKAGEAHWVTVKQGPLEGRHLLIDGPRPVHGKQSKGQILAGHGIPLHVIEKLGGTHASDMKHEQSAGPNKVQDEVQQPQKTNVDQNGNHWYSYRLRGLSPGAQPRGHVDHNPNVGRHGAVAYNRPLTQAEQDDYELNPHNGFDQQNETNMFHQPHQSGFSNELGIDNRDDSGATQLGFLDGFNEQPKKETDEEKAQRQEREKQLEQDNEEFWNGGWQRKELEARKQQRQRELEQHKKDLAAVEAKMAVLDRKMHGDSHLNDVHNAFHLGRVGGSGNRKVMSRLNQRRAAELDRTIDNAVAWKKLHEQAETLRNRIHNIESGRAEAFDRMKPIKKPDYVKEAEKQQKAADTSGLSDKEHKTAKKTMDEIRKMIQQRKEVIAGYQEVADPDSEYDPSAYHKDIAGAEQAIAHMQSVLDHPENKLQFEEAKKQLSKWKKTFKDSFYGQRSYESEMDMINFLREHKAKREARKSASNLFVVEGRLLTKRA